MNVADVMQPSHDKEGTVKIANERWTVVPNYSTENTFAIWDQNGNYHADTSAPAMDARAKLIASAPALLKALQSIANSACCNSCQEAALVAKHALRSF